MPFFGPKFDHRVQHAFKGDSGKEFLTNYLNAVLVSWRDVEARARHTALLAFVIAAFGELLIHGSVTEFQFVGLTIKSLPMFQKIAPIIVGYLIYDFCNQVIVISTYKALHASLIQHFYPDVGLLRIAEEPPVSLFFGEEYWFEFSNSSSALLALLLGLIRPFFIIAAPLAYIVHQFFHLAAANQADGLFWICVGLAGVLIVASISVVISWLWK